MFVLLFLTCISSLGATQHSNSHQFVGDSFPTCVDVIDVYPPPGSYLNSSVVTFTIKFSRYVFELQEPLNKKWIKLPLVFLSPSLSKFESEQSVSGETQFRTSETNEMIATFHLSKRIRRTNK